MATNISDEKLYEYAGRAQGQVVLITGVFNDASLLSKLLTTVTTQVQATALARKPLWRLLDMGTLTGSLNWLARAAELMFAQCKSCHWRY
jgi:hypothetical protein